MIVDISTSTFLLKCSQSKIPPKKQQKHNLSVHEDQVGLPDVKGQDSKHLSQSAQSPLNAGNERESTRAKCFLTFSLKL